MPQAKCLPAPFHIHPATGLEYVKTVGYHEGQGNKENVIMLSSRIMNKVLRDLQAITGTELFLVGQKGELLADACTQKPSAELAASVVSAFSADGEWRTGDGVWFCRAAGGGEQPEMILAARGSESVMAVRIGASELETLLMAAREKTDRGRFMRSILLGHLHGPELHEEAGKLRIRDDTSRVVYLIRVREEDRDTVMQILRAVLTTAKGGDFAAETDAAHVAVIHDLRGSGRLQTYRQLAYELLNTFNTEAMISARIAVGTPARSLEELPRSFREAQLALDIAEVFMPDQMISDYEHLGTGQLIYNLPEPLCRKFLAETFPPDVPGGLDDETMATIRQFFANSLNISETARQMYLHRNTLVYRLEKLEKMTGLDIRRFDEAMTFRIGMMVHDCLQQKEQKTQKREEGRE